MQSNAKNRLKLARTSHMVKSPQRVSSPMSNKSFGSVSNLNFSDPKNSKLRSQLIGDWKQVYRSLSNQDKGGDGFVTRDCLERALHQNKVFVGRNDLLKIYRKFTERVGPNSGHLNYHRITKELGLESNGIKHIAHHHSFKHDLTS